MADHRLPLRAPVRSRRSRGAAARGRQRRPAAPPSRRRAPRSTSWIDGGVAKDLQANRGAGVVVAGRRAARRPSTPSPTPSTPRSATSADASSTRSPCSLRPSTRCSRSRELRRRHERRAASILLLILGGNPVYTAPADLQFGEALKKVADSRPPRPVLRRDVARCATGTSPRRTTSKRGATRAPSTAPLDRPAADRRRSTRAARRTRSLGRPHARSRSGAATTIVARSLDGAAAGRRRGLRRVLAALALHDGVIDGRPAAAADVGARPRAPIRRRRAATAAGQARARDSLRARSRRLRRPVRQQRLAAGAAEAAHEAHLGQRRHDQRRPRPQRLGLANDRRRRDPATATATVNAPVWVQPGHADRRGHGAPRLRPHARGAGRQGRRLQRLHAAHVRRAVVRARRASSARPATRYALACTQGHHSMEGRETSSRGRHARGLHGTNPEFAASTSRHEHAGASR